MESLNACAAGDEPEVEIVEPAPEMTDEEAEAFLEEGNFDELITPDNEMFEGLDDGEAEEEWQQEMLMQQELMPEQEIDEDMEGKLLVHNDDDGLGDALILDIPDHRKESASELCK